MKIVLNEIIDQLYEAVKKCQSKTGVEPIMQTVGKLTSRYSKAIVFEAFAWLTLILYERLYFAEKKIAQQDNNTK